MSSPVRTVGTMRVFAAVVFAVMSLVFAISASVAVASSLTGEYVPNPGWMVESRSYPTELQPGQEGMLVVEVYNIGAGQTMVGDKVHLTDTLPADLEATGEIGAIAPFGALSKEYAESYEEEDETAEHETPGTSQALAQVRYWQCAGTTVVSCETAPGAGGVERPIKSGYVGRIGIPVKVTGPAGTVANQVRISGGGAPSAAESNDRLTIGSGTPGFGLTGFDGWFSNGDGTPDTQAGSHPYDLTLNFGLNAIEGGPTGGGLRDAAIELPPGIIGDPHAVPQCSREQFFSAITEPCPPETQVGVDTAGIKPYPAYKEADFEVRSAVYNLVPPPGVPAEFGFDILGTPTVVEFGVRSGSDYGITGTAHNLGFQAVFNSMTLWGTPVEENHDFERCGKSELTGGGGNSCRFPGAQGVPRALLTVPTSCEGPLTARITVDSWTGSEPAARGSFTFHDSEGKPIGFEGCDKLSFHPFLTVAPDTSFTDTPAGLTVDLKVPQEGLTLGGSQFEGRPIAGGFSAANVKDTTVTLPEGVAINPGQAAGLGACGPAEDGLTTEAEKLEDKEDNGPAHCPNASKVGTDEIETPLLEKTLKGGVYVMPSNPPHVQLLVTAEGEGVFVKLVGNVNLNEQTGQLVTTFSNTPALPFTDFKLSFSGGAQAALSTPLRCGTYGTSTDFTSWASPFIADVFPTTDFQILDGTGGAACPPSSLPFSPSMIAGSTTDQAGGFTDFSLLLRREDDQQRIRSLQFKTPEGLLGMISKVPLCPEAQANTGTCSSASQIGHTVVEAGPGPYPLVVPQPGQPPAPIYLTEGYKGAPYGLAIVVPLHVGPFTLQTQIVRAKIEVDPLTTQLTVTTDPLPTIIDGIPADLRAINAVIDKPGFMFNPTGCEPGSFSGTATSTEGASVPIGSHFQMGSCRSLTFKPNFKVSTSGKTSRKDGASLNAKILYPTGELGDNQASSQSNIKSVKVDLPKQLPSRLTTLQKACTAATFEANPANCPADSKVGSATAITPVLPVTLTGPAYFVSYGGAKFPELVVVLQGYGVTVDLHGETFISKAGITSSTFRQIPDVPITSFELKLPQGPFSALAANGNLCASKLLMPTAFTGQNGAVIHQNTPISVTGCPKHKATKTKKAKKKTKKTSAQNKKK
jgi:hypothetical protein